MRIAASAKCLALMESEVLIRTWTLWIPNAATTRWICPRTWSAQSRFLHLLMEIKGSCAYFDVHHFNSSCGQYLHQFCGRVDMDYKTVVFFTWTEVFYHPTSPPPRKFLPFCYVPRISETILVLLHFVSKALQWRKTSFSLPGISRDFLFFIPNPQALSLVERWSKYLELSYHSSDEVLIWYVSWDRVSKKRNNKGTLTYYRKRFCQG